MLTFGPILTYRARCSLLCEIAVGNAWHRSLPGKVGQRIFTCRSNPLCPAGARVTPRPLGGGLRNNKTPISIVTVPAKPWLPNFFLDECRQQHVKSSPNSCRPVFKSGSMPVIQGRLIMCPDSRQSPFFCRQKLQKVAHSGNPWAKLASSNGGLSQLQSLAFGRVRDPSTKTLYLQIRDRPIHTRYQTIKVKVKMATESFKTVQQRCDILFP